MRELLGWHRDLPQQEERARLVREVGSSLIKHFGGSAANLVVAAKGSALALMELVASHFPGFRDHAIYKGQQVAGAGWYICVLHDHHHDAHVL